jgi:hypothetical protein
VVIVVAQEVQKVFMGYTRRCKTGSPQFGFDKADRRVTVYYFYILDPAFGLGFIKICSYFPCPLKMWVNGTSGPSVRRTPTAWRSPNWPTASRKTWSSAAGAANRYHTELLAVFVETPRWRLQAPNRSAHSRRTSGLPEDPGAESVRVQGSDMARA